MIKKLKIAGWLAAAFSAALLTLSAPHDAKAVVAPGQWVFHQAFSPPATALAATPAGKVYFVAEGNLFCHDSAADETISLNTSNYLNDVNVTLISYNAAAHYLLVAYANGNIDLIYDNDGADADFRVVSLSDIRDASLTTGRAVRGVDFADGRIYVATEFGVVEYDDKRHEVVQSGIFGKPVDGIAVTSDGWIAICCDRNLRVIRRGERLSKLEDFKGVLYTGDIDAMCRSGADRVALLRGSAGNPADYLIQLRISASDGSVAATYAHPEVTKKARFVAFADGSAGVSTSTALYQFRPDAMALTRVCADLGAAVADPGSIVAPGKAGSAEIWSLSPEGLASYDLSGSTPAVTTGRFAPEGMSVKNVAFIIPTPGGAPGSPIWFTNLGCTIYRGNIKTEGYDVQQQTCSLDPLTGQFTDRAVRGFESAVGWVADIARNAATTRPISPQRVAPHPTDPSTYFLATNNDGILKITDGRLAGNYSYHNSPMDKSSVGCRVFDVTFDPDGNLWAVHWSETDNGAIVMLPAAKVDLDPAKVKASDWKEVNAPGFKGDKDARIFFCRHTPVAVAFDCRDYHGLVVIDTRGTYDSFGDDRVSVVTSITDQDGKNFSLDAERFISAAEDHDGRLWLGSSFGVVELTDPQKIAGSSATINRLKVPRNDGTNLADYLLGTDRVYGIAVDNSNRKWLATEMSGLYLVSERGNEILEHYTPDNSPLHSTMINDVYADPSSNSVYVATPTGLFELGGTSTRAMDSYDDLLVYPNPVRPDYSGPVTITGLMDGSLVKISDSAGQVVAQIRAEGGMAVWDACTADGSRVRTGVYFVLASSGGGSEGGSSKGGTAKIVVVN